jgi:hypothetical protein
MLGTISHAHFAHFDWASTCFHHGAPHACSRECSGDTQACASLFLQSMTIPNVCSFELLLHYLQSSSFAVHIDEWRRDCHPIVPCSSQSQPFDQILEFLIGLTKPTCNNRDDSSLVEISQSSLKALSKGLMTLPSPSSPMTSLANL